MTARPRPAASSRRVTADALERTIARLLRVGTYLAVAVLTLGVVDMVAAGLSPLAGAPSLDLLRLPADLGGLRPEGFLWLGLLVVIATPSARVAASLVGYLRTGERAMALVALLILAVIVISVSAALATEG